MCACSWKLIFVEAAKWSHRWLCIHISLILTANLGSQCWDSQVFLMKQQVTAFVNFINFQNFFSSKIYVEYISFRYSYCPQNIKLVCYEVYRWAIDIWYLEVFSTHFRLLVWILYFSNKYCFHSVCFVSSWCQDASDISSVH